MLKNTKLDLNEVMSKAVEVAVNSSSRAGRGRASLSIVNNINGRRVKLSCDFHDKLSNPKFVQFLMLKEDSLLFVAEKLPNAAKNYKLSVKSNGAIAYNAGLVNQITEDFGLDYSLVTSKSFTDIEFQESDGIVVAIVKIPSDLKTEIEKETEA
jgi:hypothetical protein